MIIRQDRFSITNDIQAAIMSLSDQRGPGKQVMGALDKKYSSKLQDNAYCKEKRERLFEKERQKNTAQFEIRIQYKTNVDPILTESDDQDFTAITRPSPQRTLVLPKNPLSSPRISASADRLRISSRARTIFVASIIKGSGGNLEDYSISQTSTLTSGSSVRRDLSKSILESFRTLHFSVLHWDGKIMSSHARWISKILYSLKMYLFQDQLECDQQFIMKLEKICLFTVLVYVPMWLNASSGEDAAVNDLQLWKDTKLFVGIDRRYFRSCN